MMPPREWVIAMGRAVQEGRELGADIAQAFERHWMDAQPPGQTPGEDERNQALSWARLESGAMVLDETVQPESEALRKVPPDICRSWRVLPLRLRGPVLEVAVIDATDINLLNDLSLVTGLAVRAISMPVFELEKWIQRHLQKPTQREAESGGNPKASASNLAGTQGIRLKPDENPIVRLVHDVLQDAIRMGSSDIHFEPFEREMRVRLRQDGMLRPHRIIPGRSQPEVVSRLKIMANLDIAERRRPQDGRIRVEGAAGTVDVRVSTLPTDHGEKVVLRILDKGSVPLNLDSLGLASAPLAQLDVALKQPYGLILMTGPTGAGKTTTLYASLNRVKSPEVNVVTVEDPIEYKLEGIIQTAVKQEVGYTFANALRTILRQDPNVILVGEIRDRETADIAVRASLTGHLVLSTLHANDAPGAIARLLDMGIEPFLLASALTLIGAQRLVRKVCPHCAEPSEPRGLSHADAEDIAGVEGFRKGRGCGYCGRTGYSGRLGVYEIMPVSEALRNGIGAKRDTQSLRDIAVAEGMVGLRRDGIIKASQGLTTLDEVYRETA
jgi:type IV pilus assembly protein PilB